MALLNPSATLPSSSADAMEIFDERYNAAQLIAQAQTWVSELGDVSTTAALSTHYPMSMLALKFQEAKQFEGSFKTIGEKDVELTVAEYQEGVEVELLKIMTNTFSAKRWADAPAALIAAEEQFKLKLIADALVANAAGACGWDDLALFHDSHLCNPKDAGSSTFDNLQATTKDVSDIAKLEEEITLMANVLDVNGDRLGVRPTHIGVPTAKYQKLKNTLKQDFIPSTATPGAGTTTMRNPYFDAGLTVVEMPQLTDNDDWYLIDMNLVSKGVTPWILSKLALAGQGFGALSLRKYDETSDSFKKSGKIGVSQHVFYGYKFLFPHAIRKIAGA